MMFGNGEQDETDNVVLKYAVLGRKVLGCIGFVCSLRITICFQSEVQDRADDAKQLLHEREVQDVKRHA